MISLKENHQITKENIQEIGEVVALLELRKQNAYYSGCLDRYIKALMCDMNNRNNYKRPLSDAYDLAQTTMLFLCEHMGKNLFDFHHVSKFKKEVNILSACFYTAKVYIEKELLHTYKPYSLEELYECEEPTYEQTEVIDYEEEYDKVDEIIIKMDLTETQRNVLDCCYNGMRKCEIQKYLNITRNYIYSQLKSIRRKYLNVVQCI